MNVTPDHAESILRDLPDPVAARFFIDELECAQPRVAKRLRSDAGLYSDAVALAAWSPLLSTTLLQNPDYFTWLLRVRKKDVSRSGVELLESLGRFAGTHSQLSPHDMLSRFRRRELLRIYLQDIRRTGTVSEITEELSHLADVILTYALRLARQQMENRYGVPQLADESGRITPSEISVIALGKLGSLELNFASDIDLMFIFSSDGLTSGRGTHGQTSNREFFNRLARTVVQLVGEQSGEGAAYRVDLRLRPYGRDGALASSVDEAVRYYAEKAQAWELQALIRSRCATGSRELFDRFAVGIAPYIFSPSHTWAAVAGSNTEAKRKIDRKLEQSAAEFNVKLGRGGIREIEFIAQAQGMARGGNDPWLRNPHTLIALGRLAERHLISDQDRIELFQAYEFLRTLEHRLQMEHGLQTHAVPADADRRALVARRMNFAGAYALAEFDQALARHTENVQRIFRRILELHDIVPKGTTAGSELDQLESIGNELGPIAFSNSAVAEVAAIFAHRLSVSGQIIADEWNEYIEEFSESLASPVFLTRLTRIAASLGRSEVHLELSRDAAKAFLQLCHVSEYFAEMLSANPALIGGVVEPETFSLANFGKEFLTHNTFAERIGALRRNWSHTVVSIGALDANGTIDMRESNRRQTRLAETSLDIAWEIAERELVERFGPPDAGFKFAVLGLGRLGGEGMDYGSDLDVVLIYDDDGPPPYDRIPIGETYARATESLVTALSSLTRDGYLYRVDLRLRPDGRNGPVCSGARAFIDYLRTRSQPWEWLAYVKLRAAACDTQWGSAVEEEARLVIHDRAAARGEGELANETRRVRERLEKERKRPGPGIDIKFGPGGLLDVYFATRFLQLRHRIADTTGNRSTTKTLDVLRDAGALSQTDHAELSVGYAFLRALDHRLRLALGRVRRLPIGNPAALDHIVRSLGLNDTADLSRQVSESMLTIRNAYSRILA